MKVSNCRHTYTIKIMRNIAFFFFFALNLPNFHLKTSSSISIEQRTLKVCLKKRWNFSLKHLYIIQVHCSTQFCLIYSWIYESQMRTKVLFSQQNNLIGQLVLDVGVDPTITSVWMTCTCSFYYSFVPKTIRTMSELHMTFWLKHDCLPLSKFHINVVKIYTAIMQNSLIRVGLGWQK